MFSDTKTKTVGIAAELFPDGSFVCGDAGTGLTLYAYPDSLRSVRAWSKRGHFPDVIQYAKECLAEEYPGSEGERHRRRVPDYHIRNWERLGCDPTQWFPATPPLGA